MIITSENKKIRELLEQEDGRGEAIKYIIKKIPYRFMDKRNMLADIAETGLHISEYPDVDKVQKTIKIARNENATDEEMEYAYYGIHVYAATACVAADNKEAERKKQKQIILKYFGND